jgi:hypothetical protein
MNSEYIFSFHNRFLFILLMLLSELNMSAKIREIRRKLEKLEQEAEELRRLKSDCNYTRKFRRMIVKEEVD